MWCTFTFNSFYSVWLTFQVTGDEAAENSKWDESLLNNEKDLLGLLVMLQYLDFIFKMADEALSTPGQQELNSISAKYGKFNSEHSFYSF